MVLMKLTTPITLLLSVFLSTTINDSVEARIKRPENHARNDRVGIFGREDEEKETGGKIINGTFVEANTYPWFTMLLYENGDEYKKLFCGGMLVSPDFILTAAHCMTNQFTNGPAVKIGALEKPYLPEDNGGQDLEFRTVKNIFKHPDYSPSTFDKDLSLLQLESPSTIATVEMDSVGISELYASGKDLWTIGLGYDEDTNLPTKLKHVEVDYVTNSECVKPVNEYDSDLITKDMLCAARQWKDSCQGDSGGPIYDKDANILVGVVSWGIGCAKDGYPGVYARISSQFEWIKTTICEKSDESNKLSFCGTCSVSQIIGSTIYAVHDETCWKLQVFDGGLLSADFTDPDCSNESFVTSQIFGEFDSGAIDEFYFKPVDKGWSGKITFRPKAGINGTEVDVKLWDTSTLLYDIDVYIPNCKYSVCEDRGKNNFRLEIIYDNYPEETSWDLKNACDDQIILSSTNGEVQTCLDPGRFTFTIRDTYGDGMCCEYGQGSYTLFLDNKQIKSGGNFTKSESTTFGDIDDGCSSCDFSSFLGETLFIEKSSSCWKIQLFYRGQLTVDDTNNDCSRFRQTRSISNFKRIEGNKAYFDNPSKWSGFLELKVDSGLQTVKVESQVVNSTLMTFEAVLGFPSCLGENKML